MGTISLPFGHLNTKIRFAWDDFFAGVHEKNS